MRQPLPDAARQFKALLDNHRQGRPAPDGMALPPALYARVVATASAAAPVGNADTAAASGTAATVARIITAEILQETLWALLSELVRTRLAAARGVDPDAIDLAAADPSHLARDFAVTDTARQAWSCLYLRYFAPQLWPVHAIARIASPRAADPDKLVRDRINRGITLLLEALDTVTPRGAAAGWTSATGLRRHDMPADTDAAAATNPAALASALAPARAPGASITPTVLDGCLPSLIGRDADIAAIATLWRAHRAIALVGPPGVGKSRLLQQVGAHAAADYAADGAWVVELGAVASADGVPRAVATMIGAQLGADGSPIAAVVRHLERRQALVLLDNCAHVLDAVVRLVDAIERSCPDVRVGLTSRIIPNLLDAAPFDVTPLALPPPGTDGLAAISESPAVELFVERARRARPAFALSARNAAAVAELVRSLDGLPLAIELAAAWINVYSVREIADRMAEHVALPARFGRGATPATPALTAALERGFALLSTAEQHIFDRLSVFPGRFSLADAQSICGEEAGSTQQPAAFVATAPDEIPRLIDGLVGKCMLRALSEDDGARRFVMLDSLRALGRQHLREQHEEDHWRRRHAVHVSGLVGHWNLDAVTPARRRAFAEIDTRAPDVDAALDAVRRLPGLNAVGLRLATDLMAFWLATGRHVEGHAQLTRLLAGADPTNPVGTSDALLALATFEWRLIHHDAAEQTNDRALSGYRRDGDGHGAAAAGYQAALLREDRGDLAGARAGLMAARDGFEVAGDTSGIATVALALGMLADRVDARDEARPQFEAAVKGFTEAGLDWAAAVAELRLGALDLADGDLEAADRRLRTAFFTVERHADPIGHAEVCAHLGHLAVRRGDAAGARIWHAAYAPTNAAFAGRAHFGMWLESMAEVESLQGNDERAVQMLAAANECRRALHRQLLAPGRERHLAFLTALRDRLGSTGFAANWDAGRRNGWVPFLEGVRKGDEVESGQYFGKDAGKDTGVEGVYGDTGYRTNEYYIFSLDPARGAVWAGGPAGAFRFDVHTGQHQRFTTADGLVGNVVESIAVDRRAGDVWIVTRTGTCIRRADGSMSRRVPGSDLDANGIRCVITDTRTGGVWFVHDTGCVGRSCAGRTETWPVPPPFNKSGSAYVIAGHPQRGDLWLGSQHGAGQLSRHGEWSAAIWEGAMVNDLAFDTRRGRVYMVAGTQGIGRVPDDGSDRTVEPMPVVRSADLHFMSVDFDRHLDRLWATTERGIYRMDADGRPDNGGAALGLPDPRVFYVHCDAASGDTWFATVGGLARRSADGGWRVFRADQRPPPTVWRPAGWELEEDYMQQRRMLPIGHRRWLRVKGFRLAQPERLFGDAVVLGHGGISAEELTLLLGGPLVG